MCSYGRTYDDITGRRAAIEQPGIIIVVFFTDEDACMRFWQNTDGVAVWPINSRARFYSMPWYLVTWV